MIDEKYYINVADEMLPKPRLKRPTKKLEIISIEIDYCKEWYG